LINFLRLYTENGILVFAHPPFESAVQIVARDMVKSLATIVQERGFPVKNDRERREEIIPDLFGYLSAWIEINSKWEFVLKRNTYNAAMSLEFRKDRRRTKWFEHECLDQVDNIVSLACRKFRMVEKRWIIDGIITYTLVPKRLP